MAVSENLKKTLKDINKKYGAGTITTADKAVSMKVKRTPSGSFGLDVELGGGWPEGRVSIVAGPYSAGKSFIAYHAVAESQKKYTEKSSAWIDQEGTFNAEWAEKFGIDLSRLEVVRPMTAEHGWDILIALLQVDDISIVVLDSMAAMVSTRVLEKSAEDPTLMGGNAKMNNENLAKAQAILNIGSLEKEREQPVVLIINQLRETMDKYKPEILPGGRAQEFFASIILWVRTGEKYIEKRNGQDVYVGHQLKFKTEKNKTFAPKRSGMFDIYVEDSETGFSAGQIDRLKEIITYGVYWGVIKKGGAWFVIDGLDRKFQGANAVLEYLRENPELRLEVEQKVFALAFSKKTPNSNEPITYTKEDGQIIDTDTGEILYADEEEEYEDDMELEEE